jgi:exo-beta-1,3-glucanase (GH17 family)
MPPDAPREGNSQPAIFLSYRRDETRYIARLIFNRLVSMFGDNAVFMDVRDAIQPGENFPIVIQKKVDASVCLIAVIGRHWLQTLKEREESNKPDWVRHEIERAYEQNVLVVPVLVEDAAMPAEEDLPPGLKKLATAQATAIRGDEALDRDLESFAQKLKNVVNPPVTGEVQGHRYWDQQGGRSRGKWALLFMALLFVGILLVRELMPLTPTPAASGPLLYNHCWVVYDPTGMRLDAARKPIYPSIDVIASDLDSIRASGFSGVVTSTSLGVMAEVPGLAKQRGLHVIQGIWDASDQAEINRAIRRRGDADAYCIGHNGLRKRYSIAQLDQAVARVRRVTGRPVATSEQASRYSPEIAAIGDWLFPDVHLTLSEANELDGANEIRSAVDLMLQEVKKLEKYAQSTSKLMVLKNVVYPHHGVPGASRKRQAQFFRELLERLNDPIRGPSVMVAVIPQGAFDAPWKTDDPFLAWDPYTGLILPPSGGNPLGSMSPAGRELLRWHPHLSADKEPHDR